MTGVTLNVNENIILYLISTTPSTCMPTRIFRLNVLHTSCAYKLLVATAVTLAFTTTPDVAVARDNAWFTYGPTIQLRNTYLGTSTTLPSPAGMREAIK